MIGSFTRRAHDRARRVLPPLALAASLLLTSLGAPAPAEAQAPFVNDYSNGGPPAARMQIVLKHIKILDDRDPGDGEFEFWLNLTCWDNVPEPCAPSIANYGKSFSAGSGETYPLDVDLAAGGFANPVSDSNAELGIQFRPGRTYQIRFGMMEHDMLTGEDDMGERAILLTEANGWGLGSQVLYTTRVKDQVIGNYELALEIQKMPFPDLRPTGLTVTNLPGSQKKRVCMKMQELESHAAGPFEVALRVDGSVPPDGRVNAPGLGAGQTGEWCVETALTKVGGHQLEVVVDPLSNLLEFNEANNVYRQKYTPAAQGPATTDPQEPTTTAQAKPVPGTAQTGLAVSAIRVNGQTPDGKDDCKAGKNAVTVLVKNQGSTKSQTAAVRLAVDGASDGPAEQAVNGLEPGQEREVKFGNVELKKGEHTLTATLVTKAASAESDQSNNVLTVTARCGN